MSWWIVLIAILVFLIGFAIHQMATKLLEENEWFWGAVIGFFVLYVIIAILFKIFLIPPTPGKADVPSSIQAFLNTPAALSDKLPWMQSKKTETPVTP